MDTSLSQAEKTMLEYIKSHINTRRTLSLVVEVNQNSAFSKELIRLGYIVEEIFSENNPLKSRTQFIGEVVIGTRPCDFRRGDLSETFIRSVRHWNKFFVLMPCSCYNKESYQKKIITYVRRYKYIEKIDSINNWIILSNLE